jgi:hypothetical protein
MNVSLGQILSVMIGGAVILLLVQAQANGSREATATTGYYMAQAQSASLVAAMDRDVPNIGAEVPTGTPAFLAAETAANRRVLEFRARLWGASAVQRVRYEATPVAVARCGAGAASCWQLTRQAYDDGAAATPAAAIGLATAVAFRALPAGVPLDAATSVEVQLTVPLAQGANAAVQHRTLQRRYRLPNLQYRVAS